MSAENAPGAAADTDEFDKEAWLAEKEPYMRKRFEELFKQQDAVDGLLAELAKERHELEEKYIKLCAPYLETRNKIVRGDEVPAGGEGDVKGIPDFWTKVFMSHEAFDELLNEKDADVLQNLQDVQVERATTTGEDGKPRWTVKLVFSFDKNDFFEETHLTKTYVYMDQEESVASEAIGCDIAWKSGKDPTKKFLKKKDGKGGWKHKTVETKSVFQFFSPPRVPDGPSQLSAMKEEELEEAIELDFALGSAIADDIVPSALKYYTGQAAMEDDDDEDDEDDDDDDDGDDDDDDDDNDEDVSPDGPPAGKEGDCKQQ